MGQINKTNNLGFICPGFPKGGTTWLFEKLHELPDFSMPLQKEIHYFDRSVKYPTSRNLEQALIKNRILNLKWFIKSLAHTSFKLIKLDLKNARFLFRWYFFNYSDKWYLSLFKQGEGIAGDITPTYCLLDDEDVNKMSKVLPGDIKIIFVLRNPIDRAWSHFRMEMMKDSNKSLNNYKIEKIKEFLTSPAQIGRTNYIETITRYKKHFPNNPIYITFYDELKQNPSKFLENIVEYLGGNSDNISKYCTIDKKVHKSVTAQIPVEIKDFLEIQYYDLIEELSTKIGGYCTQWLTEINPKVNPLSSEKNKPYLIIN